MAALAFWALLIGSVIRKRAPRWRWWLTAGAAVVVTAIVVTLTTLPLAFGRLANPNIDAQLATSATFSGLVISPRRVLAIEIEQQGRTLARSGATPATPLARYHPMNDGRNAFDYTFETSAMSPSLE